MMRSLYAVCVLAAMLCVMCPGQETLNNDAVIKLVKAGIGEDVVIGVIKQQPGNYSTSANDLVALKSAGLSDKVIAAMILKSSSGEAPRSAPAASANGGTGDAAAFGEVGVYYKKAGAWTEVLPEIVNWKTGGTLKGLASVGIVKKDVNGHIAGQHSKNSVTSPMEFVIYAPDGVAVTEYQLIRLRADPDKDYREFRTITGGVFNQKSGAMRDMVPFEGKKIGNRLYSVILPASLGAGEYGFVYLGATGGSGNMGSMSLGKMYTFHLLE